MNLCLSITTKRQQEETGREDEQTKTTLTATRGIAHNHSCIWLGLAIGLQNDAKAATDDTS